MSEFQLIKNYKEQKQYRLSFNDLTNQTFGIDFEKWYQKGCWDDKYVCYSYIHKDKVIANLSISLMDFLIDGNQYSGVQIGTVMTDSKYRNRGLSRSLMEIVLKEYEPYCNFIYLFANSSVLDFYPKFGFEKIVESTYSIEINNPSPHYSNIRKLDILSSEEDWNLLLKLYKLRKPISKKCSVVNAKGIFTWYCLNIFFDDIYFVEDLKAILIFQQVENTIHLYDIVSQNEVKLDTIVTMLSSERTTKIELHFEPNEAIDVVKSFKNPDDTLFVKSKKPDMFMDIKFPKIAQA